MASFLERGPCQIRRNDLNLCKTFETMSEARDGAHIRAGKATDNEPVQKQSRANLAAVCAWHDARSAKADVGAAASAMHSLSGRERRSLRQ